MGRKNTKINGYFFGIIIKFTKPAPTSANKGQRGTEKLQLVENLAGDVLVGAHQQYCVYDLTSADVCLQMGYTTAEKSKSIM